MYSASIIMECCWSQSKKLSFPLSASLPGSAAESSRPPESVFAEGDMSGMNHGAVNQGRG